MTYLTFAHWYCPKENNFSIATSCLLRLIRCAIVFIGTEILQLENAEFFYFLALIFKSNESGIYMPLSQKSEALSCGKTQGACILLMWKDSGNMHSTNVK